MAVFPVPAGPVQHVTVQLGVSDDAVSEGQIVEPSSPPGGFSVPAHLAGSGRETGPLPVPGRKSQVYLQPRGFNMTATAV